MFRITQNPSSGSLVQYLAKITRMVLWCPLTWTWSVLWQHIQTRSACVIHCIRRHCTAVPSCLPSRICCHNTDHVHVNGHHRTILVILAKYCTRLPDDGSCVIRNMLEHF